MDFADDSERSSQREKTSFMGKLRKSSNAQTAKDTRISGVSHIAVHQDKDEQFEMFDGRKKFNTSIRDSSNGEELENSVNESRDSNLSHKNKKKKGIFGGLFSMGKKQKSVKNEDDGNSSQVNIMNTEEDPLTQ